MWRILREPFCDGDARIRPCILHVCFLWKRNYEIDFIWNIRHTYIPFSMEVDWAENWCWMEVSTMYNICTNCGFTWYAHFQLLRKFVYKKIMFPSVLGDGLIARILVFFAFKEYMDNAHMPALPSSDMSSVRPDSPPILKKSNSDHSLYGTDIVIEDQRQLIKGLGDHVICGKYFCVGCWCSSKICNFQPVWFQIHRVSVRINIFIICGFTSKRYIILSRRRIVFATSCEIVFHRTVIMITLHYEIFLQDLNYSGD